MSDTFHPVRDTERELRDHPDGLAVLRIRRRYDAPPRAVWDAITDPERIVRWFLPLSGDLREGGRYELEDNASGTIVRCDPPRELVLTWEVGGGTSDVCVTLTPENDRTALELEHAPVPPDIVQNVGEMWGLGAGWEVALVSLEDWLAGNLSQERAVDRMANASAEEIGAWSALAERISDVWGEVLEKAGRSPMAE